ncbi:SPOR domain-containing protein [Mesobacillus jeotgali]|uniref:SPOR domain-containing protein n=1 Tax=Mesobacillus jeotgali TaxID=129985 RepID=UPI0015903FDA|nr:SPOR domain-containing protein [Mesobacillus jeotgali]
MDKHGKTITIKINGKDRPVQENKQIHENETVKRKQKDEMINKHKYDKEKGNKFPIHEIREERSKVYPLDNEAAINETAAAQEKAGDNFEWVLPDPIEQEIVKEYKIAPEKPKNKKKGLGVSIWNAKPKRSNRFYTTIFVTVFFAVLLGTGFGVTFLKFVASEPETAAPAATAPKEAPPADNPAKGGEGLELKSIPVFIVQNGIFTTEEGAKERVNLLAGKGVTAELFPVNGKFAVYLGTAGSIESAKQQAEALKGKGLEVFAKPFEISGGKASGLTAEEAKFLQQSSDIYGILMNGSQASPEEVKKAEDYNALLQKIEDKKVKDKNILKAKASMEKASGSFIAYQKTKDANQIAEMEKSLLSFLSAYQSIGK